MPKIELPLPELGVIAATRGMLGAGIELLAAGHMSERTRNMAGRTLFAIGALSTIPLVVDVLSRRR